MTSEPNGRVRRRVRVEGTVQGVGFRPFVHALATRHRLTGFVGNDPHGVFCEVEGDVEHVDAFLAALRDDAPPLADVERVLTEAIPASGDDGFAIVDSLGGGERDALVSPDTATCADCLREVFDPADRRYRYPFTNCINCGPRFTIVRGVPYDRANTTMAGFAPCDDCAREYHDPTDRRFHAQPVCCPACGPRLRFVGGDGSPDTDDPLTTAGVLLREGAVLAVKGLGGYHLAAVAGDHHAVAALRGRKHREEKPFAVMVEGLDAARALCHIDEVAERALTSRRRPVVLLPRREHAPVAPGIAPGNRFLGLLLPYTPLHHLLAREVGAPFVLTSGNVSDEPIAYRDEEALERLSGIADGFLVHDRAIHARTDDSVVAVARGEELPVRRSRGYVPEPIRLRQEADRPVLACGAELKATFCLAKGGYAFVSHHIGDLENYETLQSFTEGIAHFQELFDVAPEVVAHDLHPDYLSTKYAQDRAGVELVGVQHHHAHVAACLAEHGRPGPAIGVAFDGLGYGTDGTLWGGELLVFDLAGFERAGHLDQVALPGGAAAITEPWRMAAAYLGDDAGDDLGVRRRNAARWSDVVAVGRAGVNAPPTSSVGRLFDAVAAICDVRDRITYEGQAAVGLEQAADPSEPPAYPAAVTDGEVLRLHGGELVQAVVTDRRAGVPVPAIAGRFHHALADTVVAACEALRQRTGLDMVALSGGVFQNLLLTERTAAGLERAGFTVLTHRRVPPNDGGISFGQAAVATARDTGPPGPDRSRWETDPGPTTPDRYRW